MKQSLTNFELSEGGLLELGHQKNGREFVRIVRRKRKNRYYPWRLVTPNLEPVEDGIHPGNFALPLLAHKVKQASKSKFWNQAELSRLSWKLSRIGYKKTAKELSWLIKEPLNGYRLSIPDERQYLFLSGNEENPKFFTGAVSVETPWEFTLAKGFSASSQEQLLDDLALNSLHDRVFRGLIKGERFEKVERELTKRRHLHQAGKRPLREWNPANGYRHHFAVNRALKGETFAYSLILKVHANNPFTAAGRTGVLNNTMVEVVDELADTFDGTYKVEGVEAFFALATDLNLLLEKVKQRKRSALWDASVYLNITKGFSL